MEQWGDRRQYFQLVILSLREMRRLQRAREAYLQSQDYGDSLGDSLQCRIRIGHRRCTHSYLLTSADQPECTTCQCPLTVKHILVNCFNFNDTCSKHFVASPVEELFKTADVHNILDFIKETITFLY